MTTITANAVRTESATLSRVLRAVGRFLRRALEQSGAPYANGTGPMPPL